VDFFCIRNVTLKDEIIRVMKEYFPHADLETDERRDTILTRIGKGVCPSSSPQ